MTIDKIKQLEEWMERDLGHWTSFENYIQVVEEDRSSDMEHKKIYHLFTFTNQYHLVAIDRTAQKGYLGCQVSTRKPRAGEDYTRGNDLRDGPFNQTTWYKILADIVSYELVWVQAKC